MSRRLRIRALLLGISLLAIFGCPGAQQKETPDGPLEVKLRRVDVVDAGYDAMELHVIVAVTNGMRRDLALQGGTASLAIAGRAEPEASASPAEDDAEAEGEDLDEAEGVEDADEVEETAEGADVDTSGIVTGERASGEVPAGTIPAFQEAEVPILIRLPLPTEPDALERLLGWGRMIVDVEGELRFEGRTETFAGKREVAPPVLPTVSLQEAQVASVDGGIRGAAFFSVGIDNPNPFEVTLDRLAWGVTVGGKPLREVGEGTEERVPPSSIATFEDTLQLDEERYGAALRRLLSQPRVPYVVEGFYVVRGIRKPFRFEGEMEFAR